MMGNYSTLSGLLMWILRHSFEFLSSWVINVIRSLYSGRNCGLIKLGLGKEGSVWSRCSFLAIKLCFSELGTEVLDKDILLRCAYFLISMSWTKFTPELLDIC